MAIFQKEPRGGSFGIESNPENKKKGKKAQTYDLFHGAILVFSHRYSTQKSIERYNLLLCIKYTDRKKMRS